MGAPAVRAGGTLLGAAAGIAVVTVAARVVGFGRTAVFTHAVGVNCLADTYTVANAVPNVVFEVVAGGALASLVVPVLAPAVAAGDREAASRTTSALLTWTLLVLVPVALLGVLAAPLLVQALLSGDPACGPAALEVGTGMLRVFLPQVVLYGLAVVLTGVLQAHQRFLGPALAPLLSSLVVASAYVLYALRGRAALEALPPGQELVLSLGTTLGVAVLALSLLLPLRGTGLRLRPALAFPPGVARRVRGLAVAGVAGLAAQQLALVVALRLAARGPAGPDACSPSPPRCSCCRGRCSRCPWRPAPSRGCSAAGGREYADLARRALRAVLVLSLGGAAVLHAVAVPVARLLTPPGTPPGRPTSSQAVRAFAPGLAGYGLLALLARALYARGDGRSAAVGTVAGWLAVAAADLVLVLGTDLPPATALGLGNAVGMTVAAVVLLAALRRQAPAALVGTARTAGVAVLAAGAAALLVRAVPLPDDASLLGSTALGAGLAALALLAYAAVLAARRPARAGGAAPWLTSCSSSARRPAASAGTSWALSARPASSAAGGVRVACPAATQEVFGFPGHVPLEIGDAAVAGARPRRRPHAAPAARRRRARARPAGRQPRRADRPPAAWWSPGTTRS